ncbi:MAG: hypothetical protein GY855_17045, partial [candidate division Zixibacteria bacterium]|nr:hypothetical protein [candidate division Zixibacteria bacterium]
DLVKIKTFADVIERSTDRKFGDIYRYSQIILYVLAISMESALFIFVLDKIFYGSSIFTFILLIIILYLCASYTSLGGYIGVLITDAFQLIIFLFGLTTVFTYNKEIPFNNLVCNLKDLTLSTDQSSFFNLPALWIFLYALILCYSWPDWWIRNVSTLELRNKNIKWLLRWLLEICKSKPKEVDRNKRWLIKWKRRIEASKPTEKEGKYGFPSIFWGAVLIILFLTIMFDIINLLSANHNLDQKNMNKYWQIDNILNFAQSAFPKIKENYYLIWGGFSIIVVIFVTTIDTWLMGIIQHLKLSNSNISLLKLRLFPYLFAFLGFIIGSFVVYIPFLEISFIISLFLIPNVLLFPLVAVSNCRLFSFVEKLNRYFFVLILLYYGFGIAITIYILLSDKFSIEISIVAQLVLAVISFFVIPCCLIPINSFKKRFLKRYCDERK